jgi:hypothetical protein
MPRVLPKKSPFKSTELVVARTTFAADDLPPGGPGSSAAAFCSGPSFDPQCRRLWVANACPLTPPSAVPQSSLTRAESARCPLTFQPLQSR